MARPNWEYIRVDVLLPDHPKLDGLTASAKWTLIELWCFCGQHLTDGFVRDAKWPRFGTKRDREAIVAAGLAKRVPGGHQMHDFIGEDGHQRSRAEVMALKEKRRKSGAMGGRARANAVADALASATANASVDNSVNGVHPARGERRSRPKVKRSRRPQQRASSDAPSEGSRRPASRDSKQVLQQVPKQTSSKPVAEAEAEAEADKSMADVVHQSNGSRGRRVPPDLIDLIIEELHKATGRRVDEQWAAKTRDYILDGRSVADPAAYIRQAIRSEPDPRTRFLPLY